MISEGCYDTKDWSNLLLKLSFAIKGINYVLKYIHTDNSYFKIVIIFHNITVLLYFYSNKVALVSIGGIFKNI